VSPWYCVSECVCECVWCVCECVVCVCVCVCKSVVCVCEWVSECPRARLNCRYVLGRYLVRIFTGSSVIINDIFHNFSQFLQANQGIVPQATIASFQVLSYSSSNSYPIIDATRTYSVVKQTTKKSVRVWVYECVARYRRCCCSLSNFYNTYSVTAVSFLKFAVLLRGFLAIVLSLYHRRTFLTFVHRLLCRRHLPFSRRWPLSETWRLYLACEGFVCCLCIMVVSWRRVMRTSIKDLQHSDQTVSLTSTADVIRFSYQRLFYMDKERSAVQWDFHIVVYIVHVYRVSYLKTVPTISTIYSDTSANEWPC